MAERLDQAAWQAGLGRVAEYARMAMKTQSENEVPYQRQLKKLREENRVLRATAGLEPSKEDDSSDEELGEEHRMG